MTSSVTMLTPEREGAWSSYVAENPAGTLFHELEWRDLLRQTFKHQAHYLLALREERVVGVLPLVIIRSIFFGRSVVSVPFGVYGGILADDAESTHALCEAGRELAHAEGASYVELRHLVEPPGVDLPGKDLYCTFIADLPSQPAEVVQRMPRKARAEVRKAREKGGLTTDVGPLRLEEFHALFALNKRSLGSPVFPKSLFWNLQNILGPRCETLTVRKDGLAVATVMNFIHKDTLMAYYSGAQADANQYSASNLMYAANMEHAVELGLNKFDFGRSRRETGSFAFKKNQGFSPQPLHYLYILPEGASLPEIHASNPRFDLAKRLFRRLPPIAAEKLGSFVVKRMPI